MSGKMHKGVTVPFEIEGPVSTDGIVLLLRAKQIKAEGVPLKGLLQMLGKNLGSLLGSESVDGVTAQGDTLVFQPSKIAYVRGSIAKAQTSAKGFMVTFAEQRIEGGVQPAVGKRAKAPPQSPATGEHVAFFQ